MIGFLKKNWLKLVMIAAMLTVAIFALITMINAMGASSALQEVGEESFNAIPIFDETYSIVLSGIRANIFIYLAVAFASLAIIESLVFSMLGKKRYAALSLVASGSIALVLFVIAIILGSDYLSFLSEQASTTRDLYELASGTPAEDISRFGMRFTRMEFIGQITRTVAYITVFAIAPIIFGLKKICCNNKEQK